MASGSGGALDPSAVETEPAASNTAPRLFSSPTTAAPCDASNARTSSRPADRRRAASKNAARSSSEAWRARAAAYSLLAGAGYADCIPRRLCAFDGRLYLFSDVHAARFVARHGNRREREAYRRILTGSQRADLWRTLYCKLMGCVYANLDHELLRPLREVSSTAEPLSTSMQPARSPRPPSPPVIRKRPRAPIRGRRGGT